MSGHSKWSTIKRQKAVSDAKKGAVFTKLANAITIAVKEGEPDPESNFRLRLAIEKAREFNMPKENVEKARERGLGKGLDGELQEVVFEGFAPYGVAVIAQVVTDNKNRIAAQLKNVFTKAGGSLGGTGSVSYLFQRVGEIAVAKDDLSEESVLDKAMVAEADDMVERQDVFLVYTKENNLHRVKSSLERQGLRILSADLIYSPNKETMVILADSTKVQEIENFLDSLADLEDVQDVYSNLG